VTARSLPNRARCASLEDVTAVIGSDPRLALCEIDFDPLNTCVLVTGSIVDGFGNDHSDIDVFLINPHDSGPTDTVFFWRGGRRWVDVSRLMTAQVVERLETVNARGGVFPDDWGRYRGPRLTNLDLFHRLRIAVRLSAQPLSEYIVNSLASNHASRELCFVQLAFARSAWVDAAGAFASAQYDQCVFVAEIVLGHAIDAYTALLGETSTGAKWRLAKLHRLDHDPLRLKKYLPVSARPQSPIGRTATAALLRSTGWLIFQIMVLAAEGKLAEGAPPKDPCIRLELLSGRRVLISAEGQISDV